jgi:hypothetical protein
VLKKWYLTIILIFISLMTSDPSIFHVFTGYFYIFFGEMFIQILCFPLTPGLGMDPITSSTIFKLGYFIVEL